MSSRRSYFSLLPSEVLENIIRHLSERPRHKHWPSFTNFEALRSLLGDTNCLHVVAQERLTSVTLIKDNYEDGYDNQILQPIVETGSLFIDSGQSTLAPFLKSIRELNVCYGSTRSSDVQTTLQGIAAGKLNSIRRLQILDRIDPGMMNDILKSHGSRLVELSVWLFSTFPHASNIAQHCSQLRAIEIAGLRENPSILWQSVGSTLESLTITFRRPTAPQDIVEDIKTNCRKLRKLIIVGGNFFLDDNVLASLYMSYGANLEKVNFKELSPATCAKVIEQCPNVSCMAGNRTNLIEQMKVLGPRIKALIIQPSPPESTDEFKKAFEKSINIEKITGLELLGWTTGMFDAIFSEQRPALKVLHWGSSWPCMQGDAFFVDVFRTLAKRTGQLRDFSFCIDVTRGDIFDDFALSNKFLDCVHVTFLGDEDSGIGTKQGLKIICQTLRAFRPCKALSELKIFHEGGIWYSRFLSKRIKAIEDECVPYRKTNTFIKVGEEVYNA